MGISTKDIHLHRDIQYMENTRYVILAKLHILAILHILAEVHILAKLLIPKISKNNCEIFHKIWILSNFATFWLASSPPTTSEPGLTDGSPSSEVPTLAQASFLDTVTI